MQLQLDQPVRLFQSRHVPVDTVLAGFAALVQALQVQAPVRSPACIAKGRFKESVKETDSWRIFDNKYAVEPTAAGHLTFAMKHDNVDLLVLKRIFEKLPEEEIANYVKAAPTGPLVRKVWFYYEFLTGRQLDVPDCGKVSAVDLLDPKRYFTRTAVLSGRHKVRNNLLGNRDFCPVIRRTEALEAFLSLELSGKAQHLLDRVSPQLVARAASFLLLADSQASFAIEGERLPRNKEERWLRAVQQVGKYSLSLEELKRLHDILIEDHRFIKSGFRTEGVFLGQRSLDGTPLPEFIGAAAPDIEMLMQGLIDANRTMQESELDAVLQAAAVAFGFVYIHPYEDGNGRVHRCLIHHVLIEKHFNSLGLVFPVSSVMLKWIDEYRQTLQSHSSALMPFINWIATDRGNVKVENDTADLYRYFDCTREAEFLYRCVQQAIDHDVPAELDYLKRHDEAMRAIMNVVEMPDRKAEDFIMFMRQNDWKLPKRRRDDEFSKLTDEETETLQALVQKAFSP